MRPVRLLLIALAVLLLFGSAGGYVVYRHYAAGLPDYQQLADYYPPTLSRVHAGDGRVLDEYGTEKRVFVPIKAMPPRVIQAVLAAEDREFYQHGGVNPVAILRSMIGDIGKVAEGRRAGGASTITQQVVKNMLLSNEYKLSRKIKEAILAVRLEQALSKDRILELYLNENFFGQNSYGIAEAALSYFNKSLDELSIAEAALLAGELKGAGEFDPIRHPEAAKNRRDYVIDGMVAISAITQADADAAKAEPIRLAPRRDDSEVFSSPYFAEDVRRELIQRYGEKMVYEGGLSVRTSLSPVLQAAADKAMRDRFIEYDRKHGWRGPVHHIDLGGGSWAAALAALPPVPGGAPWRVALVREVLRDGATLGFADGSAGFLPMTEMTWARPWLEGQRVGAVPKTPDQVVKPGDVVLVEASAIAAKPNDPPNFALRQIPDVSGALVALDPHTGRVLAMVGGWSYESSKFNRASQAMRQIGSTFKPFAYLAALDNGMTPSTLIQADPVQIYQGPGPADVAAEEFPQRRRKQRHPHAALRHRAVDQYHDGAHGLADRHREDQTLYREARHHGRHAALLLDGAWCGRDHAAAPRCRLWHARQWRPQDHADPDRPGPGPLRQDHLPDPCARLARTAAMPIGRRQGRGTPSSPMSANWSSTRPLHIQIVAYPRRRRAWRAWHGADNRRGQARYAARRQDRHHQWSERYLVHGLLARSGGRHLYRLRPTP